MWKSPDARPGTFNWNDFLVFAQGALTLPNPSEAFIRSAASRAYYAAYWRARKRLEAGGITIPVGENAHQFVWNQYNRSWNADGECLGNLGRALRTWRNQADYDDTPRMTKQDAEIAVASATELIADIDAMP